MGACFGVDETYFDGPDNQDLKSEANQEYYHQFLATVTQQYLSTNHFPALRRKSLEIVNQINANEAMDRRITAFNINGDIAVIEDQKVIYQRGVDQAGEERVYQFSADQQARQAAFQAKANARPKYIARQPRAAALGAPGVLALPRSSSPYVSPFTSSSPTSPYTSSPLATSSSSAGEFPPVMSGLNPSSAISLLTPPSQSGMGEREEIFGAGDENTDIAALIRIPDNIMGPLTMAGLDNKVDSVIRALGSTSNDYARLYDLLKSRAPVSATFSRPVNAAILVKFALMNGFQWKERTNINSLLNWTKEYFKANPM
jgi:hypothetical protein